jgi:hypothetical protein
MKIKLRRLFLSGSKKKRLQPMAAPAWDMTVEDAPLRPPCFAV